MKTCSLCSNKFYARSWCVKHYKRWHKYGDPNRVVLSHHGKTGTPEHQTWKHINQRCYNPNVQHYAHYGGRGIKVCERWRGVNGFTNFYTDMGDKPTAKHSIDRIDNDGNYEPSNCKWSTQKEQMANQKELRSSNKSGYKNVDWVKRLGKWKVQVRMDGERIYLGVFSDIDEAITARDMFKVKVRRQGGQNIN